LGPASHGSALESQICITTSSAGERFRIRRLGPFISNGGFDWHKMKLQDPYQLRSQVQHGNIHVTGFMAVPVSESGEILGNPPIHIHHANLGPNMNKSGLARLSQWHGDSQCAEADGGTACYVTTLPHGFGFPVSEPLRLDIDFNDVRDPGSPDLRFWLETAIAEEATLKPVHDVGTVILGVPFRMHWWNTADLQRLYFVPSDQPSALWMTSEMPTSGTFVAGKLETHQHMFDEAWVFSGISPDELGLNSKAWHLQRPWLPWTPKENGWVDGMAAMQALKNSVRDHFERAVGRCEVDRSCKKAPSLVWTLNSTVIEGGEEREMPWPATPWTFHEGDAVSIVVFHKAMAMPGENSRELPQHLAITGHYIPEEGSRADYFFVLPSSHSSWAWLNSVNWLSTLIYHGGPSTSVWCWQTVVAMLGFMLPTCAAASCLITASKRLASCVFNNIVAEKTGARPRYLQVCCDEEAAWAHVEDTEAPPQEYGSHFCEAEDM